MPKLRPLVILLAAAFLSLLALSRPAGAVDNPDYASVPPPTPTQHSVPPTSPPTGDPTPPTSPPTDDTPATSTPPSGTSSERTPDPTGYTVTGVVSRTTSNPQASSAATISDPETSMALGTTGGTSSSEALAYTGADTAALVAAGAGLMVLGGLVVLVRRRAFA